MYGKKDAAQCFDVASENAMTAMAYDPGKLSPCLHHSSVVDMSVFRHGDDFIESNTRTQQNEFEEQLSKHLIVKHLATLGPCTALGDVTEVRIPTRIVRWVKPPYGSARERIEYEDDPRHAELIIHQLGLSCSSRSVSTPSEKPKLGVDLSSVLNSADHTLHRSATMRLCYLALDRTGALDASTYGWKPGGAQTIRQILDRTRMVGSGICGTRRGSSHVVVFTDSDHAGCLKTRKKYIIIQIVLWFSHATFHQHYARSHRPEFGRVRVSCSGEGDVSRTWSSLNAQRFVS